MSLSDWGSVGNIILGISSVATAAITAIVLFKQHNLQKEQHSLEKEKLNAQQMEHQPLFQFHKTDEMLTITNAGCELSAPVSVKLRSMITVQTLKRLDKDWQNCIYCHPVLYYNRQLQSTGQLKGDVAIANFNPEEYAVLKNKISELGKYLFDWGNIPPNAPMTDVHSILISDVVQIDYADMYKVSRTAYFWNSQPISKTQFEQLVEVRQYVPFGLYGVNDIKLDEIIERVYGTAIKLKV